jgi:hypothetical protein
VGGQFIRFEIHGGKGTLSLRLIDAGGTPHRNPPGVYAAEKREKVGRWYTKLHNRKCFAMRFDPEQFPYSPTNVISGVSRPESWTNLWMSGPGCAQTIDLEFSEKVDVGRVHLTFDTNLDRTYQGTPPLFKAPECVRDYRLLAFNDEVGWEELLEVKGNYHRHCIHHLPVKTMRRLRIQIEATNGSAEARVYEIRAYAR